MRNRNFSRYSLKSENSVEVSDELNTGCVMRLMEKAQANNEIIGYGASKSALVKERREKASQIAKIENMRGHEKKRKNSLVDV